MRGLGKSIRSGSLEPTCPDKSWQLACWVAVAETQLSGFPVESLGAWSRLINRCPRGFVRGNHRLSNTDVTFEAIRVNVLILPVIFMKGNRDAASGGGL